MGCSSTMDGGNPKGKGGNGKGGNGGGKGQKSKGQKSNGQNSNGQNSDAQGGKNKVTKGKVKGAKVKKGKHEGKGANSEGYANSNDNKWETLCRNDKTCKKMDCRYSHSHINKYHTNRGEGHYVGALADQYFFRQVSTACTSADRC